MSLACAPDAIGKWAEDWRAVSFVVLVRRRTDQALLVALRGTDGREAFWLPASLVIVDDTLSPSVWAITIPAWLADDRGLGATLTENA